MLGRFTLLMKNKINRKKRYLIVLYAIIGLCLFLGVVYFARSKGASGSSAYQAVFLDNNQVYFGKIKNRGEKYITIADVYYFGPSTSSGQANSDDIVLVKLGSEAHGPTDEMEILENHILYIEELSPNSRVLQAIMEYKER